DILYRNDGDRFTDVTDPAGITLEGRGLGVAFADYDLDGDTDLYVANDGTMNFLYENQRGTFVEVGLAAGTRYDEHGHAEAGMGTDFGDYDRDGD
ncbi:MAG: VCBS repeat-containing protein, partial [Gemmatimonadota bacterium]|nr:VCBS repeat-containing protein [Gemmatimonadota bacterium]